jgi:hypothetical protein
MYYCLTFAVLFCGAPSLTKGRVCFVYAAGAWQRSLSRVRVPWDPRPYFSVSDLRLPFLRLLRLAGLWWRYSTPPPHGLIRNCRAQQRISLLQATSQHGHSWHRVPLGHMAIYLFSVKKIFSTSVVSTLI